VLRTNAIPQAVFYRSEGGLLLFLSTFASDLFHNILRNLKTSRILFPMAMVLMSVISLTISRPITRHLIRC